MYHKIRWTAEKIARRIQTIEPWVYRRSTNLSSFQYTEISQPNVDPLLGREKLKDGWRTIQPNSYWGKWQTNFVLHGEFQVPKGWEDNQPVALYLPIGDAGDFSHPEALVYIDDQPYAACDRHHQEIILPKRWCDRDQHTLWLSGWTGLGGSSGGERGTQLFMGQCQVVQIDQPTRYLLATARIALGIANSVADDDPVKGHLLNALDGAFKILDTRQPIGANFYSSVSPAHEFLVAGIKEAGSPLNVEIIATGHAHLDVAWLWTLDQTRAKSRRTFHNVLRLMEEFPKYHFTQSQSQLYDFVLQDDPALFEEIRERITESRWEPIGGMWVEADCNITGPESLVRQLLLGRSFFRHHFGPDSESPVLWLPDVFGYTWNLPQLIKGAGLHYFMTIKIGWNQYNRLPYDSFLWQGLDGTRVLTHFITTKDIGSPHASTYNSTASPGQTLGTWVNFQQKELQRTLLMAYGHGDGGGGPTREMLENIREMAAFPSTPRIKQGSVKEYFQKLEAESGNILPTWNGELYLETHRGTYTTQSRNKRANRKSEFLLHDTEFVATLASIIDSNYTYPADTFRKAWELVCLNQFHDIIPGSSITKVYQESQAQYMQVREMTTSARDHALAVVAKQVNADVIIVNPTSFKRNDLVFWNERLEQDKTLSRNSEQLTVQVVENGTLIAPCELKPYSVIGVSEVEYSSVPPNTELTATPTLLENNYLRVEFNDAGDIIRIYDKVIERQVLPEGAYANQFQAFEDRPLEWDAWDIDIFYDDKMWLAEPASSVEVVEEGPLRATLRIKRIILNSEIQQHISLCLNSARLDFDTLINWRERNIMLKVAFPVDVLTPQATYEIQWGNVQRPTHRNTSWDWARFETCAQKWVDLSEGDYGVSLLNDSKYGHDIRDNVIRLTLLRSTTLPDPIADQGEHRFVYSLLPHLGDWQGETISEAYKLNDPLIAYKDELTSNSKSNTAGEIGSLLSVDSPNIVIETVKQAEDGDGIIVRLYEAHRSRGWVRLQTAVGLKAVWITNLLEENHEELIPDERSIRFHIKPYEIITLRLVFNV